MNWVLIVLRVLVASKELRTVAIVMSFLILIPLVGVISIASAPQALLQSLLNATVSAAPTKIVATGIKVLGNFSYAGDEYEAGNCTYWVYARRAQVGQPIPNTWGDASSWAVRAFNDGYRIDHTPTQYSIMQTSTVDNGLGHVAFVESVKPNGTWTISEMNVFGLYIVDNQDMSPAQAANYSFIHTKE